MSITLQTLKFPFWWRNTELENTPVTIHNGEVKLLGWNIINPNTTEVYVKFWDAHDDDVVLGTTVPILTLFIPGNSTVYLEGNFNAPQRELSTALSCAVVTGIGDSSTTDPATSIYIEILYAPTNKN